MGPGHEVDGVALGGGESAPGGALIFEGDEGFGGGGGRVAAVAFLAFVGLLQLGLVVGSGAGVVAELSGNFGLAI